MGARVGAVSAVDAPGDPEIAAEIAVVVAKIVLGLASSSVRTEVGRRDDVVVDVDHGAVAFDRRDRDAVRRRGPPRVSVASKLSAIGCDSGMVARSTSSASPTLPGRSVLNACAIARAFARGL